jgi:hypothetical protein
VGPLEADAMIVNNITANEFRLPYLFHTPDIGLRERSKLVNEVVEQRKRSSRSFPEGGIIWGKVLREDR